MCKTDMQKHSFLYFFFILDENYFLLLYKPFWINLQIYQLKEKNKKQKLEEHLTQFF